MLRESLHPVAVWTIEMRWAKNDRLYYREQGENIVVDGGANLLALLLVGQTAQYIRALAAGDSNQAAVAGQSSLVAERYRGQITSALVSGRAVTVRKFISSVEGNGYTYQEAGLFTAITAGAAGDVMFNRKVHTALAKNDTKTMTYICTVSL